MKELAKHFELQLSNFLKEIKVSQDIYTVIMTEWRHDEYKVYVRLDDDSVIREILVTEPLVVDCDVYDTVLRHHYVRWNDEPSILLKEYIESDKRFYITNDDLTLLRRIGQII
jgi:hypothetical protein